jgi:NADPH:quinone reductase-like Zn-dependent oxidoreductase
LEANTAHIPDQLSFSKAAAIGVGVVAAAESLFNSLGLSFPTPVPPPASKDWILIWGGASVTGQFAIQLAKLHSLRIATVASPHNFLHLRSLGAEFLLDRYKPLAAVEALRPLKIKLALDCVGADTAACAASALAEGGKVVCLVKKPKESQAGVELGSVLIKRFHEDEAYSGRLMEFVEELLEQGVIVPPKTELLEGGLEAVEDGLRVLREGVSGRKLVVRLVNGPAKYTDQ